MIAKPVDQVFWEDLVHRCRVEPEDAGIVALSGGADSTWMALHMARAARRLRLELSAMMVDHGLRAEAREEVAKVTRFCRDLGLELSVAKVDTAAAAAVLGGGLEEAARDLRYAALERERRRRGARWIAVAHTATDLAETVLLRLERGTGLDGLAAMCPRRGHVIRPMLRLSRERVRAELRRDGVSWCEDRSNADRRFSRARVRREVLPSTDAPRLAEVARLALEVRAALSADEGAWAEAFTMSRTGAAGVVGEDWMDQHGAIARRRLRAVLARVGAERPPSREATERILELARGRGGRSLAVAGLTVSKESGPPRGLFFGPTAPPPPPTEVAIEGPGEYRHDALQLTLRVGGEGPTSPIWGRIDLESPVVVRRRLPGDRLALNGRKLKREFQRAGLWRSVRDWVPVAVQDAMVTWTAVDRARRSEGYILNVHLDPGHPLREWTRARRGGAGANARKSRN